MSTVNIISSGMIDFINQSYKDWTPGDLVMVTEEGLKSLHASRWLGGKPMLVVDHALEGGIFMLLGPPRAFMSPDDVAISVRIPVICLDFKDELAFSVRYSPIDNMTAFGKRLGNLIQMVKPSANSPIYPPICE